MKKVLLIVKNKKSRIKKNMPSISKKRGSELAQTVLITAIMITIIAALFFPQIKAIFQTAMTQITGWFNEIIADIAAT